MKITSDKFFLLLVLMFLLQQTKSVAQKADIILFNGKETEEDVEVRTTAPSKSPPTGEI